MFKTINNYPNYEIDENGNVRNVKTKKILKQLIKQTKDRCKYKGVYLYNKNGRKHFFIHRLVASAFIPNPNGYSQVNHKDENTQNNTVNNLEWCTPKYNSNYGNRNRHLSESLSGPNNAWLNKRHKLESIMKMSAAKLGKPSLRKKSVIVNGMIEVPSLTECATYLNVSLTQVFNLINGKRFSDKYTIQYKEEL